MGQHSRNIDPRRGNIAPTWLEDRSRQQRPRLRMAQHRHNTSHDGTRACIITQLVGVEGRPRLYCRRRRTRGPWWELSGTQPGLVGAGRARNVKPAGHCGQLKEKQIVVKTMQPCDLQATAGSFFKQNVGRKVKRPS